MTRPVVYVALQQFCEADDRPRRLLQEAGVAVNVNRLGRRMKREDLLRELPGVDAVLAGIEPYDAELLAALPQLRCISRCGVGTDAIDLEAAQRLGVAVLTTGDEVVEPVAQLTIAMMLALARQIPEHLADARQGRWTKRTGVLLSEWTIGLVGFGRIGRRVEQYLRPFQPTVLVADPQATSSELPKSVHLRSLETLLVEADCVSLHVSRPRTEGVVIGRKEFALMKPGAALINTSRGYLVDEAALHDAIQEHRLSAAALDVFEAEPHVGPLATLPQVLCTPHIGSLTRASRMAMEQRCAQHVVDFFAAASTRR
ncbi:MAG: phosphoglycerate dehydrogenase [Candidatus Omnitrophica bacterium]|nr:phosphoglycerate dehydrogenase [Candidatus Omnitrophota bacterium]